MKSGNHEKPPEQLETGVFILPRKKAVTVEHECVCKALQHEFKTTRLILGSVFVTTHVAALIGFAILFGGGKVHDNELLALQTDLAALQLQCNSSLQDLRYKLKVVEKLFDQKMISGKFEESEKLPNSETLEDYDSSIKESEDIEFYKDLLSNIVNETVLNTNNEQSNDDTRDSFEIVINNLFNGTMEDPALPEKICTKLLMSDAQDLQEYSFLCEDVNKRSSRTKRSNLRGKHKRRKSTSRQRGPHIIRGPTASHFKGAIPETYIRDGGLVAPWYPDDKASAAFTLKYEFREGKGTVEVTEEGLYFIYAQVYYLTTELLNTYVIHVREKDGQPKPIAYCSSNAVIPAGGVSEVSCYTAVIRYLNVTNQVYITQRDRNRRMILREGHSFMGLVLLNSPNSGSEPKRRRNNRN